MILSLQSVLSYQFGKVWFHSALSVLKSPETFLQTDGNWEEILHILSSQMNREWHLLRHYLQLVELLWQVKKLHVEVQEEVEPINTLLDVEDVLRLFMGGVNLPDVVLPLVQVVLFSCLEGLLETVADLLQFTALVKILPVVT